MDDKLHTNQEQEIDEATNAKFEPGHNFDGIRELANEPPFWLNLLFIITVLFSYAYWAKYHLFKTGDLMIAEYHNEFKMAEEPKEEKKASIAIAEIDYTQASDNEDHLKKGEKIYKNNCAVCHLAKGEGMTGPNLTDEYWIHGGSFADIVKIIEDGVISKGMIPWKNQLNKKQIHQVSSFIVKLQGTNPPNAKEPEGEKYIPED